MIEYPPAVQKQMADELHLLPNQSVIADTMIPDYKRMRDACRQ